MGNLKKNLAFFISLCYSSTDNISNLQESGQISPLFLLHENGKVLEAECQNEMSTKSGVEAYLMPVMEKNQFELVDVEYVKEAGTWYLRAYIDKEGGFTVDDCELVSRQLGEWLDREDFIDDSYILEVSSPGLGRPLKKEKDFKRSLGEQVEVRLYRAVDRQKEFTGALAAYDEDTVTLRFEDGTETSFEKKDIALIRLAFDF